MSEMSDMLLNGNASHPDWQSYEQIWDKVISPTIQNYKNMYVYVSVSEKAEESI